MYAWMDVGCPRVCSGSIRVHQGVGLCSSPVQRWVKPSSQYDARRCVRCVVHASALVATQCNAEIDLDPILAFPCVAFMRQIEKFHGESIFSPFAKFNDATHARSCVTLWTRPNPSNAAYRAFHVSCSQRSRVRVCNVRYRHVTIANQWDSIIQIVKRVHVRMIYVLYIYHAAPTAHRSNPATWKTRYMYQGGLDKVHVQTLGILIYIANSVVSAVFLGSVAY